MLNIGDRVIIKKLCDEIGKDSILSGCMGTIVAYSPHTKYGSLYDIILDNGYRIELTDRALELIGGTKSNPDWKDLWENN